MTSVSEDMNHEKPWNLNLMPDLTGKVALVTGASGMTSIGFNIAHQLTLRGAKVYIGARSADKAQAAIDAILSALPTVSKHNLDMFIADLDGLEQVKEASERFLEKETRLDILIHNAARLHSPLVLDKHGISLSIVTNYLAPFVITQTLLPLLNSTVVHSDVRVVMISSLNLASVPGPIRLQTKESFNMEFGNKDSLSANRLRYGAVESFLLASALYASELQRRLQEEGSPILVISVHPGTVRTAGALDYMNRTNSASQLEGATTPLEGANTALFAATAPEVSLEYSKYAGSYLTPFGVIYTEKLPDDAKNPALATELWSTTEAVVADVFSK